MSLEGEEGLCDGDNVFEPAAAPSRGDAVREVEETTELGLGGGR